MQEVSIRERVYFCNADLDYFQFTSQIKLYSAASEYSSVNVSGFSPPDHRFLKSSHSRYHEVKLRLHGVVFDHLGAEKFQLTVTKTQHTIRL